MEALKAARLFQSATGVYNAAKETVALAECSLIEETDTPTAHLSSAWQEMLSHAITKVIMFLFGNILANMNINQRLNRGK